MRRHRVWDSIKNKFVGNDIYGYWNAIKKEDYIDFYTGFNDKNGVEIFERDFVIACDKNGFCVKTSAEWSHESKGFQLEDEKLNVYDFEKMVELEVIGNHYKNKFVEVIGAD